VSGEVQSAGLLPDQAGSFLHHPLVILIGYQLANEQVPVIVWVRHRLQNLVLLLIVSWPELKGCNRCGTFHLLA